MREVVFILFFLYMPAKAVIGTSVDHSKYPFLTQIETYFFDRGGVSSGNCTGTHIKNNVVLTAAHCVDEMIRVLQKRGKLKKNSMNHSWVYEMKNRELFPVLLRSLQKAVVKQIVVSRFYRPFSYSKKGERVLNFVELSDAENMKNRHDLAVLILDKKTYGPKTIGVCKEGPQNNDSVRLIGYGFSRWTHYRKKSTFHLGGLAGTLNTGNSFIHKLSRSGVIALKSQFKTQQKIGNYEFFKLKPMNGALALEGDSGGPLLRENCVLGVFSAFGGTYEDVNTHKFLSNYYTSFHNEKDQGFLRDIGVLSER